MIHVRLPFSAVVDMTCGLEAAFAIHGGFKPPLLTNFPVLGAAGGTPNTVSLKP